MKFHMASPPIGKGDGIAGWRLQALSALEMQHRGLLYEGQLADRSQSFVVDAAVHFEQRNGVTARCRAAKCEGRDVDPSIAKHSAEAADHARLVLIDDVEHVRRELGVEIDVAYLY